MACYVISNRILARYNVFKIGHTKLSPQNLRRSYQRYLFDATILLYYETPTHTHDEKILLKKLSKHRLINSRDRVTEWLHIEYPVLKSVMDDYFNKY